MEVKAAFKQAVMSIPEGSTCYWLVKKENQHKKQVKVDKITANHDTDVYEEIFVRHGAGMYLVWLFDNNDRKLIEVPIRFEIPGENEDEDEEECEDEDEESTEDLRKHVIKKIRNELEMDELISLKSKFSNKNNKPENENDMQIQTQRYLQDLERKLEDREKRLEEKLNAINSQSQQNGIFVLIAEMQKSSSETTRMMMSQQVESNKMMMQLQSENQKTLMAIMNKPEKNFMDSPFLMEVYKKSTEKPKNFLDDSIPKVFDFMLQNNQNTMKKIMDMQFELGQNDIFFQRMQAFQKIFSEAAPHFKDLVVKLASIKAMKDVEKIKHSQAQNTHAQQPQQNTHAQPQANSQAQNTQTQPQANSETQQYYDNLKQQQQMPKPIIIKMKPQPQPEQSQPNDLQMFFLNIYERLQSGEDEKIIEQEIKNTQGALEQVKTNEQLKSFVQSEGGKIKELFERLQNE